MEYQKITAITKMIKPMGKNNTEMALMADGIGNCAFVPTDKIYAKYPQDPQKMQETIYHIHKDFVVKWQPEKLDYYNNDKEYLINTYKKHTIPLPKPIPPEFIAIQTYQEQAIQQPPASTYLPPLSSTPQTTTGRIGGIEIMAKLTVLESKLNTIYNLLALGKEQPKTKKEPQIDDGLDWD